MHLAVIVTQNTFYALQAWGMIMKKGFLFLAVFLIAGFAMETVHITAAEKQSIKALYIPLADHYAGIVAYEKYRDEMEKAEYTIERMKSWPLLRAYFMSGEVDMAYIISPMAMDMFAEKPKFRWVSLLHRDGNALAINDLLNADVKLPEDRERRKPDEKVAEAYAKAKKKMGRPSEVGVPSLLATHTVVLYKYLKDHGKALNLGSGSDKDVLAIEVPPPKSPSFIKKKKQSRHSCELRTITALGGCGGNKGFWPCGMVFQRCHALAKWACRMHCHSDGRRY